MWQLLSICLSFKMECMKIFDCVSHFFRFNRTSRIFFSCYLFSLTFSLYVSEIKYWPSQPLPFHLFQFASRRTLSFNLKSLSSIFTGDNEKKVLDLMFCRGSLSCNLNGLFYSFDSSPSIFFSFCSVETYPPGS
jgi:hypothetical protein